MSMCVPLKKCKDINTHRYKYKYKSDIYIPKLCVTILI